MSEKQYAAHLLDEPPMLVYPSLAVLIGINHAIVFQQLHFLMNGQKTSKNKYTYVADKQGVMRWWVYNTYPEWRRDYFPWISTSALKGIFTFLERNGLVLSMQGVKNKSDRRKWYTIDYEAWDKFCLTNGQNLSDQPMDKKCLMVGQKMSNQPSDKKCLTNGQKVADDSSETSPNTSAKSQFDIPQGCITKQEHFWNLAYGQLKLQIDRNTFDTWLGSAHFLKFEDGFYVIGVPNRYALDMLQHRLYRDIRRVLSNAAGGSEIEVRFEEHKQPVEPEGDLPLFKKLAELR